MVRGKKAMTCITRSSEYRSVYDAGRKLVGRYYVLFYRHASQGTPRYGITVSGKVGGAVVRNRAKRRTREAVKMVLATRSLPADMVLVALGRIADARFDELVADIKRLLSRVEF